MANSKRTLFLKRRMRVRNKLRGVTANQGRARLSVHRTSQHIYAQIIAADGGTVLASASSIQADLRKSLKGTGNVAAAQAVGKAIAERALAKGVTNVAFDRSGFQYHGRVQALADAAREAGLQF